MAVKEVKTIKRRLRSAYVTSVLSISLVLFMIGLVGLLLLNTKKVSDYVKENIGFSVIIKDNTKEVDIIHLQKLLDARPFVKSTKYITKEEAARELKEELGEDFISFLGYNPLLASIDVRLYAAYANADSIAKIELEIQGYPQVKELYYQKSLVHLVNDNVKKISLIIMAFSCLLFFIAVTLINNTVRLAIYAKRFIIHTMQLVGATRAYIRKPFLTTSVATGILGALIAIGLLAITVYFAEQEMSGIITLQDIDILVFLFLLILLLGVIINFVSSYLAVNKYLHIKIDKLYF